MTTRDATETRRAPSPIEAEFEATLLEWMGDRSVYWSAERDARVVTGYAEIARILRDANSFWRDMSRPEEISRFWAGGRHLNTLEGRDHQQMHRLHMRLTGETFAEDIREKARELCRGVISRLVKQGRAELAADYADTVVLLIGCDFVGYDIDASTMETLRLQMQIRAKWKEALHAGNAGKGIPLDSKIARDGQAALKTMASILLPIIRNRREHPREDLISTLWREGPSVFPDWNERDILSTCWSCVDNETKHLLRGLVYILCRDLELQAKLRRDPSLVAGFVEEGLRFLSPLRIINRVAKQDVEIDGQKMHRDDSIFLITPLANRDEEHWNCPHAFDAERQQESTHFGFGYGPGYCVGRYVGRVEAEEAVKAILAGTSMLCLDPKAAKPQWYGETHYSVLPIHAILQQQ